MSDAHTNEIDLVDQYRPNVVDIYTLAALNTVQGPIGDTNNITSGFLWL